MTTNDKLVIALRRAARELARKRSIRDLYETLGHIVTAAVQTVPGVDAGSISITKDGEVASCSPTALAVAELDALQGRLQEGPCIAAILDPPEDGLIVADDLAGADGERWPGFAPPAVAAGYRSMMSAEVSAHGRMRASLNLYAHRPHAFDGEARLTAGLFAVQAAMLLYGSEQALYLQRALETRDAIGQAKGILRERFGVSDDRAFQMLVTSSQETNIKLVDVVRWLLDEVEGGRGASPGASRDERE